MKHTTAAGLLLFFLFTAGCRDQVDRSGFQRFTAAFHPWATRYNPSMTKDQADEAARVFWAGSAGRQRVACHLAALGVKESSLQVRKYQPWVKQNKDYLGCHNEIFFCELRAQGMLDRFKRKGCKERGPTCWTPEARDWLTFLTLHPEIGTLLACLWFCRLLGKDGGNLEHTVRRWKGGDGAFTTPVSIIQTLEYWAEVSNLALELEERCAAVKGGTHKEDV